jgi:hypothetical protein
MTHLPYDQVRDRFTDCLVRVDHIEEERIDYVWVFEEIRAYIMMSRRLPPTRKVLSKA